MPLHRIRATLSQMTAEADTSLHAEAVRLAAGRLMLNRRADVASALIVAQGEVIVGVEDDDEALETSEGVLLPLGQVYSLRAETEALVLIFAAS